MTSKSQSKGGQTVISMCLCLRGRYKGQVVMVSGLVPREGGRIVRVLSVPEKRKFNSVTITKAKNTIVECHGNHGWLRREGRFP
jgi:hypothetical protein